MWSRLTNIVGVALLVTCFVISAIKLITRAQRETSDRIVVIRLCHWQLETGMREAFDALAAEYQKLHPHVRIEQTAVPGRVYGTYVRTRLAGNNPPDIVEMGRRFGRVARAAFSPAGRVRPRAQSVQRRHGVRIRPVARNVPGWPWQCARPGQPAGFLRRTPGGEHDSRLLQPRPVPADHRQVRCAADV